MSRSEAIRSFLADLRVPSGRDERPYLSFLIAVAHGVLGAALFGVAAEAGQATTR